MWFTRGPADVAVRASFAIPSVITPALVGGRLIVDGGVTNPVPLEPLAPVSSDLLLAVSLTGRRSGIRGSTFEESSDPDEVSADAEPRIARKGAPSGAKPAGKLTGRIRTAAADVRDADLVRLIAARFGQDPGEGDPDGGVTDEDVPDEGVAGGAGVPGQPSDEVEEIVEEGEQEVVADDGGENLPGSLRIFDVVTHTIEAMESIVTAYRMAGNRPDVLVEVPSDACSTFDFHRADELIELGRRLTAEALDRAGV